MITEHDLRWAYQAYLGRAPDSQEAIAFFLDKFGTNVQRLQQAFLDSREMQDRVSAVPPTDRFCVWKPGKPRIAITGGALAPDLARAVAALADVSVLGADVVRGDWPAETLMSYLEDADCLLVPLDDTECRRRFSSKTLCFQPPVFTGIHPDLVMSHLAMQNMPAPAGRYHSRIVLESFLDGVTINQCLDRYADGAVMALQPRHRYETARSDFLARDAGADIGIAAWFLKTLPKQPLLYTPDHASAEVVLAIARLALRRFEIDTTAHHPALLQTALPARMIWPVYPAVARLLRLDYATAPAMQVNGTVLPLPEFVVRSYHAYRQFNRDALSAWLQNPTDL